MDTPIQQHLPAPVPTPSTSPSEICFSIIGLILLVGCVVIFFAPKTKQQEGGGAAG